MTNVNIARHVMHACLKMYIYRHLSVIYIILNHYFTQIEKCLYSNFIRFV